MDEDMDFDANLPQPPPHQPKQRYDNGRKMLFVSPAFVLRGKLTLVTATSSSCRTVQAARDPTSPVLPKT